MADLTSQRQQPKSLSSKSLTPVHRLRLFRIHRTKDGKNISGVGKIIDGVQFENGQVVVCWKSHYSSLGVFKSMEDFVQVHAKPFFKENEFEWVEGYEPSDEVEAALDEVIDYVMRKRDGIKEKTKGDIISKVCAMKRSQQREVDPIIFNKRNGKRTQVNDMKPSSLGSPPRPSKSPTGGALKK